MKASMKFREDQRPLLRAKVPLNILTLPFQSGIVAGDSKELSLNLSTFFESGPSFKISYRPNDSNNPFGLVFKTGIGHFGSPISSPFTMSAEFNLVSNQNPRFFLRFKPKFGDFCLKKSQSSDSIKGLNLNQNGVVPGGGVNLENPVLKNGYFEEGHFLGGKVGDLPAAVPAAAGVVERILSDVNVGATTVLPLRSRAVVNFQWGVRFPPPKAAEEADMVVVGAKDRTAGISIGRLLPTLVMNKIGIEHVAKRDCPDAKSAVNADVAGACLDMKKQLEVIQAENGLLRKALDDLRLDIASGKMNLWAGGGDGGRYVEGERSGARLSGGGDRVERRRNGGDKKGNVSNGFDSFAAEEELKKALKGDSIA